MGDYATFQYSGKVAPMEEVQSVDGNRKRIVYSTIDKVLGGASEYQLGDAGDNLISYKEYTTTNSRVSLEHSTIFNNSGIGLNFLAIFIKEAAASLTPDCKVYFENTVLIGHLSGIGDFLIMPMRNEDYDADKVQISSSTNNLAKVDIIIGEI
tara:strand:+ start:1592 stop:2050 length:459 start_codon:yes stop_codon:yes gene_type:complete